MRPWIASRNVFVAMAFVWPIALASSTAAAVRLPDGTPIHVRPRGVITSETVAAGQAIEFVVTRNVVIDGELAIEKGASVAGVVIAARPVSWGFSYHRAQLAFKFVRLTARNGRVVKLRDAPIVVDRTKGEHELQWASEADTFDAYVDGNYQW